jgi:hypothetical protein
MMGTQSTLFGPAKYSYIPQHLQDNELVAGNALVQSGTFIAILVGTMLGGVLIAEEDGRQMVAIALVSIALAGYIASFSLSNLTSKLTGTRLQKPGAILHLYTGIERCFYRCWAFHGSGFWAQPILCSYPTIQS